MLADCLKDECWHSVIPGVKMYKLSAGRLPTGTYSFFPKHTSVERLEFFFCCGGSFTLQRRRNPAMNISDQEIFFFSDCSDIKAIEILEPLIGYCISMERQASHLVFISLYQLFAHADFSCNNIDDIIHRHGGCMCIRRTAWNESVFTVLRSLPYQEQGYYCMMKITELLYLLRIQYDLSAQQAENIPLSGYSSHTLQQVRAYMESHLNEKLTILSLSRQFHISSTALKNGFRTMFGQPIHTWLQQRRMQQAAELLRFSDLTVLQIAQSVGYDGVSQFNVLFKRQYGITPSHYRKMSDSPII